MGPTQLREPASLIVADGFYEPRETEVLRRLAASMNTFIDVGANTGYYSVILTRANTKLRTVAIEPVEDTRKKLEENLRLNDLHERVGVVPMAVANRSGTATMFLPGTTGTVGSSLRDLHPLETSKSEEVPVTTLDELLGSTNEIGGSILVKIDVEGAEGLVLQGATELLSMGAFFVVELSRKWLAQFGSTANDIIHLFSQHQYCCYAINSQGLGDSLLSKITIIDDETLQVNFLFLPLNQVSFLERALERTDFNSP